MSDGFLFENSLWFDFRLCQNFWFSRFFSVVNVHVVYYSLSLTKQSRKKDFPCFFLKFLSLNKNCENLQAVLFVIFNLHTTKT